MNEQLQAKIKQAMNMPLVGNVHFDNEEMRAMKAECLSAFRMRETRYSKDFYPEEAATLFVLLVNIAKSWGDGLQGAFWVKAIDEILGDTQETISPLSLYDPLESLFYKHSKTLFYSQSKKRMIRETILFHATAPKTSMEAFIRFLWTIYVKDMVTDSAFFMDHPIIDHITRSLHVLFSQEDEKQLDKDSIIEGQAYAMRAALKYGFSQCPHELMRSLVATALQIIDTVYYNDSHAQSLTHFEKLCIEATQKILLENNLKRDRIRGNRHSRVSDPANIRAFYALTLEREPILCLPTIYGLDGVTEDRVYLELTLNDIAKGKFLYYITGLGIHRHLRQVELPVGDLIENVDYCFHLQVKLYFGDMLFYDSESTLYRDFLLFNAGGNEETKSFLKPGVYYLLKPSSGSLDLQLSEETARIGKYLSSIFPREDDSIASDSRMVSFSDNQESSVFRPDGIPFNDVEYYSSGERMPIYQEFASFQILLPDRQDPRQIGLFHNDQYCGVISEIGYRNESSAWRITLDAYGGSAAGPHTLRISSLLQGRKILHEYRYACLAGLRISCEQQYLFDAVQGFVCIWHQDKLIHEGFVSSDTPIIRIPINSDILCVKIPRIQWRLDNSQWYTHSLSEPLWHKDKMLHNNVVLLLDNSANVPIRLEANGQPVPQKNGNYLLGNILTQYENELHGENIDVTLLISQDAYRLFSVAMQPFFFKVPILTLENGVLSFSAEGCFIGDHNTCFEIFLVGENGEQRFRCGLNRTLPSHISEGWYAMSIYLVDTLSNQVGMLLYQGDEEPLGNPSISYFHGYTIRLDKPARLNGQKFRDSRIEAIHYLREEFEHSVYSGIYHSSAAKRQTVEFDLISEKTIRIYFLGLEGLQPTNFDKVTSSLTSNAADGRQVLPCKSVYFTLKKEGYDNVQSGGSIRAYQAGVH